MLFAMLAKKLSIVLIFVAFLAPATLFAQQSVANSVTQAQPPDKDSLLLLAPGYHHPMTLKAADLKAIPHIKAGVRNPHTNANEIYSGVSLAELLAKMGVLLGDKLRGKALASYVVATGSDGYKAVIALAEIDRSFHPGDVLVADTMNGKPLDAQIGPFRLVVTEDKRPARSVRNLVSLELSRRINFAVRKNKSGK